MKAQIIGCRQVVGCIKLKGHVVGLGFLNTSFAAFGHQPCHYFCILNIFLSDLHELLVTLRDDEDGR
jgi:hypothetical protein